MTLLCNDMNPPDVPEFLWDAEGNPTWMRWEDIAGYLASQKLVSLKEMSPGDMQRLHRSLRSYRNQMLRACCFGDPTRCPYGSQCEYAREMVQLLLEDNSLERVTKMLDIPDFVIEAIKTVEKRENHDCRIGNTLRHFQLMDEYVQDKRSKLPSKWITRDFYRAYHRRVLWMIKKYEKTCNDLLKLATAHREVADGQRDINIQEGALLRTMLESSKAARSIKGSFWRPK